MDEVTGIDGEMTTEFLLGNYFPDLCGDKINTVKFLQASRGVVALIDKFGKVFSPLSYDVSGNINKIQNSYDTNPKKFTYIEDLILSEKQENGVAVDALLWLQRDTKEPYGIDIWFERREKFGRHGHHPASWDLEKNESLQKHMTAAYTQALEPYHGWFSKNLFRFFLNMVPKRSALLSAISEENKATDEVMKDLEVYVKNLETNVNHLIMFFRESDLLNESKVP